MKKLILLGIVTILFASCQEQRYFSSSPEIDTLKSGIAAYEAGEWDSWKSHFADNGEIYVNSKDSITVDERVKGLQAMSGAMSSYGFEEKGQFFEMVIDDDKETWVNFWGQHTGTFAATGNTVSVPVHLTVQFVDGKISEEHVFYDGTAMNAEFAAIAAATAAEEDDSAQADTEGEE